MDYLTKLELAVASVSFELLNTGPERAKAVLATTVERAAKRSWGRKGRRG